MKTVRRVHFGVVLGILLLLPCCRSRGPTATTSGRAR